MNKGSNRLSRSAQFYIWYLMLKAIFFGTPQIYLGHTSITHTFNQQGLALFAYLAMTSEPQSRTFLAEMLWPNLPRWRAKMNLRYLLRSLQRRIGNYLTVGRKSVAFNHKAPYWIDVKVFMDHAPSLSNFSTTTIEPEIVQPLVALYTNEFLTGFSFQDTPQLEKWVLEQRCYLHNLIDDTDISVVLSESELERTPERQSSNGSVSDLLACPMAV